MEQKDSVKGEMQSLIRLQQEQLNVLSDMRNSDTIARNMENINKMQRDVNFDTGSMYNYAAQPYGVPGSPAVPGPQVSYNPFVGAGQMLSPQSNQLGRSFVDNASSLVGKDNKYGFLSVMSPESRMSDMSRTLNNMDYAGRMSQAAITGAGALGSAGLSMGMGALLPGIGGLAAGLFGGVAIGAITDISVDEIKKENALKKYLYKNSSMFINPEESNNDRNLGGFSRKESTEAATFVRTMNDEFYMKDEEVMTLLQKFTEGGMLKSAKDLEGFKDKMKSLTKTVKEGALMLNESYDSIADLLAEMRKAGINEKDYKDLMGMGNIIGSMSGQDGSQVVRSNLDFVKGLNAGTPYNGSATSSRLNDTSIYVADYYNQLESKPNRTQKEDGNFNMIKNLGGPVQASQYLEATMEKMVDTNEVGRLGAYFFDYNKDKKEWQFNSSKFEELLTTNKSLEDILDDIKLKFQKLTDEGEGFAIKDWDEQDSMYLRNNLKDGQMSDFLYKTIQTYTTNSSMAAQGATPQDIMSQFLGIKDAGTQNLLTGFLEHRVENPGLAQKVHLQNVWQKSVAEVDAKTPSFTEWLGSKWDGFKDWVSGGAVALNNQLGEAIQGVSDWWTGRKDKVPVRYDKTFTTRTDDMSNVLASEVKRATEQTNELIASTKSSLEKISSKGFSVNEDVEKFVNEKFKRSEKKVQYSRDIITDWNEVAKDLQKQKKSIIDIAEKNNLSEVIVASLHKFNQSKPKEDKINIEDFARRLGQQVYNYGGNENLGALATLTSTTKVDKQLAELGYDMQNMRRFGTQEEVQKVGLEDLKIGDGLKKQIDELLGQSIAKGYETGAASASRNLSNGPAQVPQSKEQLQNMDLRTQSNVTADDLNKIIEKNTKGRDSIMRGLGQDIMDASKETGLDAMYLLAHAAWETGWGTSNIAKSKGNFFGIGAFNSNPNNAYSFGPEDYGEAIKKGASWIAKNYQNNEKHQQNTLEKMINGSAADGMHRYAVYDNGAPNTGWVEGISSIMQSGLKYVGKGYGAGSASGSQSQQEVQKPGKVSTRKEEVVYYTDGKQQRKTMGDLLYDQYNMVGRTDKSKSTDVVTDAISSYQRTGFKTDVNEVVNKLAEALKMNTSGKDASTIKNEVLSEVGSKYSSIYYQMEEFKKGNKSSEGYKTWASKSAAEKMSDMDFVSSIDGKREVRDLLRESGIYIKGYGNLKRSKAREDYFTEDDVSHMKRISEEGVYNQLGTAADISTSKAIDRLAKLIENDKAGKKTKEYDSRDELEKMYNLGKAGLSSGTDKSNLGDKFLKTANLFEGDKALDKRTTLQIQGDARKLSLDAESYMEMLAEKIGTGKYTSVQDALNSDADLRKRRESAEKSKYNRGYPDKTLEQLESEMFLKQTVGYKYDDNLSKEQNEEKRAEHNRFKIMEAFGTEYMQVNKSQFSNLGAYNASIWEGAQGFYNNYSKALSDFMSGKKTEDAQKWEKLDTAEKDSIYEMLKKLEYGMNIDSKNTKDKYRTIEEIESDAKKAKGDKYEEKSIYTDDEQRKFQFLHKDKAGKWYYDESATSSSDEKRTAADYRAWKEEGGKVRKTGTIEAFLKKNNLGFSAEDMGFRDLQKAIRNQVDTMTQETSKLGKSLADTTSKMMNIDFDKLMNGQLKSVVGVTKQQRDEYNSGSADTKNKIKNEIQVQMRDIADAMQNGNVEFLEEYKKKMKDANADIDFKALDEYIAKAKEMKDLDISPFTKMIDEIQHLVDISKDVGNTGRLLDNAMKSSDGGDSKFNVDFEKALKEGIDGAFGADSELAKRIEGSSDAVKEVADILADPENSGLSVDDIEKLTSAMSDGITKGLSGLLQEGSNDDINKFKQSDAYEIAVKSSPDLDEKINRLSELNVKIAESSNEDKKTLVEEKNKMIDDITKSFADGIDKAGDILKDGQDAVQKTGDDAKTALDGANQTIESFSSTFASYDSAIKGAIDTMNKTISELQGNQTSFWDQITSILK